MGDGDTVALVLVPLEGDLLVLQAHAGPFEAEADLALVGMEKGGDGVGDFYEVGGGGSFGRDGVERFQDAGGSDAGSAAGEGAAAETGEIPGVFGEVPVVGEGFLFLPPAFEAAGTPGGKVWFVDGVPSKQVARIFLTRTRPLSQGRVAVAGSLFSRRRLSRSRMVLGRRAILPRDIGWLKVES